MESVVTPPVSRLHHPILPWAFSLFTNLIRSRGHLASKPEGLSTTPATAAPDRALPPAFRSWRSAPPGLPSVLGLSERGPPGIRPSGIGAEVRSEDLVRAHLIPQVSSSRSVSSDLTHPATGLRSVDLSTFESDQLRLRLLLRPGHALALVWPPHPRCFAGQILSGHALLSSDCSAPCLGSLGFAWVCSDEHRIAPATLERQPWAAATWLPGSPKEAAPPGHHHPARTRRDEKLVFYHFKDPSEDGLSVTCSCLGRTA